MSAHPVVLLHGLASSSALTWGSTGFLDILRDVGREPLPIDLLGHGSALQPTDPDEYSDMAGWAAARCPHGPIDIVAFSLGARLAIEMAARGLVDARTMVLAGVGANLFTAEDEHRRSTDTLAEALADATGGHDPIVDHFRRLCAASGSDPRAIAASLRATSASPWPPDFAAVTASCVVIVGEHDFAGPADPLVEALPTATQVVVPRADHFSLPKSMGFFDAALDALG